MTTAELIAEIVSNPNYRSWKADQLKPVLEALLSGASSYKVYTALLTQSGTNAPVATVLENTIGDIVWSYSAQGSYLGTLNGAFTDGKTWVNSKWIASDDSTKNYDIETFDVDRVAILSLESTANADNVLNGSPIEIRVYD